MTAEHFEQLYVEWSVYAWTTWSLVSAETGNDMLAGELLERPAILGTMLPSRLLEKGATVTFLLRSTSVFDGDSIIQKYVQSGHARLLKGDALVAADTQRAWDVAGVVDAVIFTVGGYPSFHLLKGFVLTPPNLVTQCFLNVICTMPTQSDAPQPKIIAFSSTGVTPAAHAALPLPLKPLYSILAAAPHRDKVGMERVIAHCAGWHWDPKADSEPSVEIMGQGWKERNGLPAAGTLKHALVIRAGLLTDGPSVADEIAKTGKGKSYRVSENELGGYTISRKDAAHFVVDALTVRWDEFNNKRVNLTY
ncbi:hypothetical protein GGX14DRAFT_695793 [Mycena pura]|uniref:NAD(P)-binding domain-containing protein n=1 Tax=Mycena pura TaxID=153505 RepID=A0AAD6YEV2_9AGAR|nr:hypothetical protein GGX14DRAFT_695793 [Mycena pura]